MLSFNKKHFSYLKLEDSSFKYRVLGYRIISLGEENKYSLKQ